MMALSHRMLLFVLLSGPIQNIENMEASYTYYNVMTACDKNTLLNPLNQEIMKVNFRLGRKFHA